MTPIIQSNPSASHERQQSASSITRNRPNDVLYNGKNTNRASQQRQHNMTAMIAAASQPSITFNHEREIEYREEKKSSQTDTLQAIPSDKNFQERFEELLNLIV